MYSCATADYFRPLVKKFLLSFLLVELAFGLMHIRIIHMYIVQLYKLNVYVHIQKVPGIIQENFGDNLSTMVITGSSEAN